MRSSPTSPREGQQAAYQARLEAEGDFLQQVNAGVKPGPGEGPKWKTVTTSFPQDDAGRQKWAGVHKANIVAEAVSECRNFSRPLAEFRVTELAPQGFFVAERVGDSAGSVEEWHQNVIDAGEFFLRETGSEEIWYCSSMLRVALQPQLVVNH